jgi:hypothetical protein
MKHRFQKSLILRTTLVVLLQAANVFAADWTIPMGGNTFRTAPQPGRNGIHRNGTVGWGDSEGVFSVYFHIDRPADLQLAIQAHAKGGTSSLRAQIGNESYITSITGKEPESFDIGKVSITKAGYVRVDLQGQQRTGSVYAELQNLLIASGTENLTLDYVQNNTGNMFYWGRRGPSVHLRYEVPKDRQIRYAYSEIKVPIGEDPLGSYYMANGFAEGYFGIQVNSPTERRVLFSIWSPFKTDNPKDIPKDQQIIALASGEGVRVGEFGNEGSGGQSYFVYPWKAGITYRFLTKVKPDGNGGTVYTSWFGDKSADSWHLIASFRRPKTDTNLKGFHSFLESFSPSFGHIGRRAFYQNIWVHDTEGQWHECTRARFSVDATGRGRHRLDYTGEAEGKHFYLRNCGFFNETGKPGETFQRASTFSQKPLIDFEALPPS